MVPAISQRNGHSVDVFKRKPVRNGHVRTWDSTAVYPSQFRPGDYIKNRIYAHFCRNVRSVLGNYATRVITGAAAITEVMAVLIMETFIFEIIHGPCSGIYLPETLGT